MRLGSWFAPFRAMRVVEETPSDGRNDENGHAACRQQQLPKESQRRPHDDAGSYGEVQCKTCLRGDVQRRPVFEAVQAIEESVASRHEDVGTEKRRGFEKLDAHVV